MCVFLECYILLRINDNSAKRWIFQAFQCSVYVDLHFYAGQTLNHYNLVIVMESRWKTYVRSFHNICYGRAWIREIKTNVFRWGSIYIKFNCIWRWDEQCVYKKMFFLTILVVKLKLKTTFFHANLFVLWKFIYCAQKVTILPFWYHMHRKFFVQRLVDLQEKDTVFNFKCWQDASS